MFTDLVFQLDALGNYNILSENQFLFYTTTHCLIIIPNIPLNIFNNTYADTAAFFVCGFN